MISSDALVKIRMQLPSALDQDRRCARSYIKDEPPGPAGRWFVQRLKNREMQEA